MAKNIDSLVKDIQGLFEGHIFDPQNLSRFSSVIEHVLETQFREFGEERKPYLRMSNLGKPLRQLWFEVKSGLPPEKLSADTKFKFLYGHLLEAVIIALSIEAGHKITDLQRKVEVDGIYGNIDCICDGFLVDVKSCSTFSFNKFKSGKIREDDPFGYIGQLSGYHTALVNNNVDVLGSTFLAIDKVVGHLCLLKLEKEEINQYDIKNRIKQARDALIKSVPPETLCYESVPIGKSGNYGLPVGCSYCSHKWNCHEGLREFIYSSGPVYLTHVAREPNVFEKLENVKGRVNDPH